MFKLMRDRIIDICVVCFINCTFCWTRKRKRDKEYIYIYNFNQIYNTKKHRLSQ